VLALVVHQVLHMLREVLVAVVRMHDIVWFVIMYSRLSRRWFFVQDTEAGNQGRKARRKEGKKRCEEDFCFHYHETKLR